MRPDLSVWMPSPDSGTSTSTVLSAMPVTASSDCPTPTVSIRRRSNPLASSASSTSRLLVAGGARAAAPGPAGGCPAGAAPRGQGANVDAGIERDRPHPDPVAEEGAAGERAGGVHGDDRDGPTLPPPRLHQMLHQGGLARARRAGDPDPPGAGQARTRGGEQLLEAGTPVLNQRNRAGEGRRPTRREVGEEL